MKVKQWISQLSIWLVCFSLCTTIVVAERHLRPRQNNPDANPYKGTKFANTTVYGAMIMTDPMISAILGRDFHRVPQGVNGSTAQNAEWRISNGRKTISELPFHVDEWFSLHAPACPNRQNKGNDRGVALSHFQVWNDFITQGEKHKSAVSDNDILVMLEDDAVVTISDVKEVLEREFLSMTTDHVFLGWCYGRRFMPMCTHAYAITRAAVARIVKQFDICYPHAIDAQLRQMSEKGLFTWRKPLADSLKNLKAGFEDNPHYFTRGIFIQKNGLVSFNHHGFQNNAG
jgi:hypothetical protein